MANKIQIKRGTKAKLPTLSLGELALCTDTNEVYIGISSGNLLVNGGGSGASVPTGCIVMWSGSVANIPTGWVLCNGSNSTPDLRNRFIVGAGSTYAVGDIGGSDSVTLTLAQLASHNHTTGPVYSYTASVTPATGSSTLVNAGTSTTPTSTVGSSSPHENRPPYYALCYIMKT